jgi:hypothetical protein
MVKSVTRLAAEEIRNRETLGQVQRRLAVKGRMYAGQKPDVD